MHVCSILPALRERLCVIIKFLSLQYHSCSIWVLAQLTLVFPLSFPAVTDEDTVKRYYAKFEERFFQTCEKELLKINTFYSGIHSCQLLLTFD